MNTTPTNTPLAPVLPVDFNDSLGPSPTGNPRYGVGYTDAWQLDGLVLHDSMLALFIEEGELQAEGILRVETEADGRVFWSAEINPTTLCYHIFIPHFHGPLEGRVTLGVEGTREADLYDRFKAGMPVVLLDGYHMVDAQIAIEQWDGRAIWITDPDWATYRERRQGPTREVLLLRQAATLGAAARTAGTPGTPAAAAQALATLLAEGVWTIPNSRKLFAAFTEAFQRGFDAS